jgi:competence protein ComFB
MSFETIRNYYEHLVMQRIMDTLGEQAPGADDEYLADVACVALNHLPPRYMRHEVDMAFYVSPQERDEILAKVNDAVGFAVRFIAQRQQSNTTP